MEGGVRCALSREGAQMNSSECRSFWSKEAILAALALGAASTIPIPAKADFGGVGFWLPGMMGSLAAVPGTPGWGWADLYIHLDAKASGDKEFQRGGSIVAGVHARADAVALMPSYTFETPVFGGQASIAVAGAPAWVGVDIDATLTGPRGNQISGHASDSRSGWADVFYTGSLKWNQGVHNTMVYFMGNIPNGTFDVNRLANLSLGFAALDAGAGYTYLNPQTGHEFSAVAGLTYSFINPDTQYRNGIDFHLDWGASQFVSKTVHIGLVGYFYQQLTGDSGAGAVLGDFKGRTLGIGPQIGFIFSAWEGYQGYLNVKGYKDFATENRVPSTTVWVTLAFSPAAPTEKPSRTPMIRK
jgi:hypothetical protein